MLEFFFLEKAQEGIKEHSGQNTENNRRGIRNLVTKTINILHSFKPASKLGLESTFTTLLLPQNFCCRVVFHRLMLILSKT